jgi:hypothetical protein
VEFNFFYSTKKTFGAEVVHKDHLGQEMDRTPEQHRVEGAQQWAPALCKKTTQYWMEKEFICFNDFFLGFFYYIL